MEKDPEVSGDLLFIAKRGFSNILRRFNLEPLKREPLEVSSLFFAHIFGLPDLEGRSSFFPTNISLGDRFLWGEGVMILN